MSAERPHVPDERLLLLADGELAGRRAAATRRHLQRCRECQARFDRLSRSSTEFSHAYRGGHSSPDDATARSRDAIRAQLADLARADRRPSWAIAAMLLAATLIGLEFLSNRSQPFAPDTANARPIAYLTPGATRPIAIADLCARRVARPRIPTHVRQAVVRDYRMELVSARDYELDYLITPELGGSDDQRNLWPERYSSAVWNARVKDELERLLPRLVCAGSVPLAVAQHDIATDWIGAYKKYFHTEQPLYRSPLAAPLDEESGDDPSLEHDGSRFRLPSPRYESPDR